MPDNANLPSYKDFSKQAAEERISFLEKKYNIKLDTLRHNNIDTKRTRGVVENYFGAVQVPMGLVGPIQVNGDYAKGEFYTPFATYEGVISISTTRGARAINASGGATTKILDVQMTRAPMFMFNNLAECEIFIKWVKDNAAGIKEECDKLSNYGRLQKIEDFLIGNSVHLRMCYDTVDAAGQNMVTIMTDNGIKFIRKHFEKDTGVKIRYYSIEGNLSGDKKTNKINFLSTSGRKVFVETFITKDAFENILLCDLEKFRKIMDTTASASAFAGTQEGFAVNAANVIAAIYTATGQDIGCVYESSVIYNHYEVRKDGLYWSALCPNIIVGVVASAQRLPSQRQCLEILQCTGKNGANKLAEIIAAFCAALDVSTLASIVSDTFARAHQTWGRGLFKDD